jgi:polyhydroxybutyrate depolymerase
MYKVFTVGLFVLLTLTLGCLTEGDSDRGGAKEEDKGEVAEPKGLNSAADGRRTLVQDSAEREYFLHVPASYDSDTPTPLVINFHGFGGNAGHYSKQIGERYKLNSVADTGNFLVAYPQAVGGEKGGSYWDPGNNGSQNIAESDVYFTEQLIADIGDDYNVDLSRVYATGYSNGGMMAYGLACSRSDLIAAVGIMSGIMLDGTCGGDEYTSVIIFHGISDGVLPYEGNHNYQPISDVVNFWTNHNSIPASSLVTTELNGGDVVRAAYSGGNEDTSVVLYTVNAEHGKPGGHVWFSDDIDGLHPNQILWDFLSKYSLDD